MKLYKTLRRMIVIAALPAWFSANAETVNVPHTFTAGTPAVAVEVNANFAAVKTAVDDNHSRLAAVELLVTTLQAQLVTANNEIAQLKTDLATVNANSVLQLDGILTLQTDNQGYPAAIFSAANVHINNGSGVTENINGLGNLVVGYDEIRTANSPVSICSFGEYTNQVDCEASGGTWAISHKSGSHIVVIGPQHNYSRYAGLVAGHGNSITGLYSNIAGGVYGNASGPYSSVNGGSENNANGYAASVSGGLLNSANGFMSGVSGGRLNSANGHRATVSGGLSRTAAGTEDWVAGTLFEEN